MSAVKVTRSSTNLTDKWKRKEGKEGGQQLVPKVGRSRLVIPGIANTNTGCPAKFEIQMDYK